MARSLLLSAVVLSVAVAHASVRYRHPKATLTPRELADVQFILYIRDNQDAGSLIPHDFETVDGFDPAKNTYMLVHGFASDIEFAKRFVPDLLSREDCNVIGLDWGHMAPWTNYFESAENCMEVGKYAGEFVARLSEKVGLSAANFHGIGHSLGGQAMGHLGRSYEAQTGAKLERLTILDPAKPYFELIDPSLRVNKNDGKFVDVIHTNSGDLWNGCLSFMEEMGHIDFYPAGGEHQPGCTEICVIGCTEDDLIDLIKGGCSHDRAVQYFIESINSNTRFSSTKCNSWADFEANSCQGNDMQDMGMPGDSSPSAGRYWLHVNEDKPYAQG